MLVKASQAVLAMWKVEQNHEERSKYRYPELSRDGMGSKTAYTGMTWTGFRPSDDPCQYHYLVPSNIFAIKALGELAEIADELWHDQGVKKTAVALQREIRDGIQQHALHEHPKFGTVYCYEVDGLGGCTLMDDANVPSLLALPYIDPEAISFDWAVYNNTRRLILSPANPYYFEGSAASGISSPHMLRGETVWPMALVMQALTSDDDDEKRKLVNVLAQTTGGTNFMHESFNVNDPRTFTRPWFAWANALFAELLFHVTGRWCTDRVPGADPTNRGQFKPKWGSGTLN